MIVLKFGGTSLESSEAIERMTGIVRSRLARRPALVVSAHGKTTDSLVAMAKKASQGDWGQAVENFKKIETYHLTLGTSVAAKSDFGALDGFLASHFAELFNALQRVHASGKLCPRAEAEITSFGERLSSGIIAFALRKGGLVSTHLDARVLVRTDETYPEASPMLDESCARIRRALFSLSIDSVPVLGGFMGSTAGGTTTTLGRNSSNLSAVIVAAAVNAEELEIWTDVDGVYAHDPRLITDQKPIEALTFEHALQMATHGAKVFHHAAIALAQQENIPIWIKNSRNPEAQGTKVCSQEAAASKARLKFFPHATAAESGIA